jgi:hypothetical protein
MPNKTSEFTTRDLQYFKWTALGMTRKQMAEKLGLSVKTVEADLAGTDNPRSIANRFGIRTPAEITRFAMNHNLITPDEKAPVEKPAPKPAAIDIKGIDDLKAAILRGATNAANGNADCLQINALCQCSDAWIRILRTQMDAAFSGRTLPE